MTRHPHPIPNDSSHLADAADDANILLAHAEAALALMARVIEGGDYDGHHGIPATLDLACRAFAGWQERYPDALCIIATRLRATAQKGPAT
jgi:hypothetical protein